MLSAIETDVGHVLYSFSSLEISIDIESGFVIAFVKESKLKVQAKEF